MGAVVSAIVGFFNRLLIQFQDIVTFFQDFFLYIPKWVYNELCLGVVVFVNYLASLLPSADSLIHFGSIPSGVAYLLQPFHIVEGLLTIISAYGIRFIIRRLPVVG